MAANWKSRYKNLLKRAGGGAGKSLARGGKDSAKVVASGAAAAVGVNFVRPYLPQSIPYASGIGLAVAGHFARRKYPHVGAGMLGAAGFLLIAEAMQKNPELARKLTPGASSSAPAPSQVSGYFEGDAGSFGYAEVANAGAFGSGDAGALQGVAGYDAGALQNIAGYDVGALQGVAGYDEDSSGYGDEG